MGVFFGENQNAGAPPHLALFSAMVGTGWQLIAITVSVIGFALLGPLHGDVYEERGEMVTSFIVCYALTSTVAGYTSGQLYKQYYSAPRKESVSRWQQTMLLTVALLPGVVMALAFGLNCVALYYDTSNTVPPATLAKIGAHPTPPRKNDIRSCNSVDFFSEW